MAAQSLAPGRPEHTDPSLPTQSCQAEARCGFLAPFSSGVPGPLSRQLALGPWGSGCAPAPLGCCWQGRPARHLGIVPGGREGGRAGLRQTDSRRQAHPRRAASSALRMRPSGALPTAEAAWATPGRELAAVVRGGHRAGPRPDGWLPAGTPDGSARPAASQTRRRRDAAGVAAATDTQLRVSRDAPAALGNQPAASAAACSDAGREHGLLALAGQIGSSQGPRGRLLMTQPVPSSRPPRRAWRPRQADKTHPRCFRNFGA